MDHTTTTKGKYSFQAVAFAWYSVFASPNGATGMTQVEISPSSASVASPEGDLYLQSLATGCNLGRACPPKTPLPLTWSRSDGWAV